YLVAFSVFFCQAEDGIRDDLVTGVQTCALPISVNRSRRRPRSGRRTGSARRRSSPLPPSSRPPPASGRSAAGARRRGLLPGYRRSEERRVGKEGRSERAAEE